MVKESRNFRLDAETLEALRRLSDKWKVSQAQVLVLLVREADKENKDLRVVKGK